jgi:hypothetical protein
MRREIPGALLSTIAEIAAHRESHATLNSLFIYCGASGDPPMGSKPAKALEWLRATNKDSAANPMEIAGRIIENCMDESLDPENVYDADKLKDRERLSKVLAQAKVQYVAGGKLIGSLGAPSKALEDYMKDRDAANVELEFNRALSNVDANPREAVSAASNILESIFKIYIEEEGLEIPAKQDLKSVWLVVRKHLGFDPGAIEDQDLQKILTGLVSLVEGVGALRTHASSAHGAGKKNYKLEPRHARLAIHGSHTVALFVMETWTKRKTKTL